MSSLLLAVGALFSVPLLSVPASATPIDCLSALGNYFAGFATIDIGTQGITLEGTKDHVDNNDGPICDTQAHDQNVWWTDWVMLANGAGGRAHIQVGYFRYWGGCVYWYTETQKTDGGTFLRRIHTEFGCRTGAGSDFSVAYEPLTGHENMGAGGNLLNTTTWSIYTWWTEPFMPQVSAEADYIGTDVPGTSSNPTHVTAVQVQQFNDSWTSNLDSTWLHACPWPFRYYASAFSGHAFTFYSKSSRSTSLNC